MPKSYNEGKNPDSGPDWSESVQRDGIKLIHGRCEPLYEFDLREYHSYATGMPSEPPNSPTIAPRRRK